MILEIMFFIFSRWQLANIMNYQKHKISYANAVGRNEKHHHANFIQNWSIQSRDIAIFRFSKWQPPPSFIFKVTKYFG